VVVGDPRYRPDGVDDAVGIGGCRRHHERGLLADGVLDGVGVGTPVLAAGHARLLDVEVVGALRERGVGGLGQDDVWLLDAPLLARPVAGGLHRQQDALGAAGGDVPDGVVVAAQPVREHPGHLVLVRHEAGERRRRQRVLCGVQRRRLVLEPLVLLVDVVDQAPGPSGLPVGVALAALRHLLEDVVGATPRLGQAHGGHSTEASIKPVAGRDRRKRAGTRCLRPIDLSVVLGTTDTAVE